MIASVLQGVDNLSEDVLVRSPEQNRQMLHSHQFWLLDDDVLDGAPVQQTLCG